MHGWLVVDKPEGLTSNAVLTRLKRCLRIKKMGHAGTLDPLASGVLPVAFGEATKAIPYVMCQRKTYRFVVEWGSETTTGDREGNIFKEGGPIPTLAMIQEQLPKFHGRIIQQPPIYSAIKIEGRPAYSYARKGLHVDIPKREVEIFHFQALNKTTFEVTCSKGTYIRSLAQDLATALGTYAHLVALRRLKVGNISDKDAILLEKMEKLGHIQGEEGYVIPIERMLDDILVVNLPSESIAKKLRQGQPVLISEVGIEDAIQGVERVIFCRNIDTTPLGFAFMKGAYLYPRRILNY